MSEDFLGQPHSKHKHVFAVIRWDGQDGDPEERITITKILHSEDEARSEMERLNALNRSKGCRYFYQVTRLVGSKD